jgi:Toastrack DUF4097
MRAARPVHAFLGVGCAALLLAPMPARAQQSQRYGVPGSEVAIYDVAGTINIMRGTGPDVQVQVTRVGSDAGRLSVATGEISGRQTLRVVFPGDEVDYAPRQWSGRTTIHVRSDGTFGAGGRRVRIGHHGLDAYADLNIAIPAGHRVAVFLGAGHVDGRQLDGDLLVNVAAASVDVDGMHGALVIDTGSGSVSLANADGAASIDSGSGSVKASGVKGAELKIDTGSGSIHASDIAVQSLKLKTGSGGIHALGVAAPQLLLDTGSGSVELALTADVDQAKLSTGSGSVTVQVPSSLGARLDIHTGSGGIHMDVPVQVVKMGRSDFRGSIGDGNGTLQIGTGSGSVRITH